MNKTMQKADEALKDSLDKVAGSGTADKTEGAMTEAIGTAQQKIGHAVGSQELEARGVVNEVAGKAQHAVGEAEAAVAHSVPKKK